MTDLMDARREKFETSIGFERTGAGWKAIVAFMAKNEGEKGTGDGSEEAGGWFTYKQLVDAGVQGSDLLPRSVENLVSAAVGAGYLEKTGSHNRGRKGRAKDTRRYRLG